MKIYKTLENDIKIIEYEEQYAKSIAQMWNESSEFWIGSTTVYTEDGIKSEIEKSGCLNSYLALAADKVIGYCDIAPSSNDEHSLYVNLLNVHPDYHGKGVGKALIDLGINRTIELQKARIDLYTWAGNTAAMPLYKRMGFFWEENTKYTHLTNFMPTVVTHPLFKEFFIHDSWHKLSTRPVDMNPCGIKQNGFEMFEYSFQKEAEILKVGFERRGKQVRFIETNDYKIELLAHKHKLAFGLSYPATFQIENKSGKQLDIEIQGKNDKNISFDYHFSSQVEGVVKEEAPFFVGEVKDAQGEDKIHPCVLADVTINGKTIAFGVGINTKFPLENEFIKAADVSRVGAKEQVFINIKNLLLEDATINFTLPKNDKIEFMQSDISIDVPAGDYGSVCLDANILNHGHIALPIVYNITPRKGISFVYEKKLHVEIQGFSAKYYYENEQKYIIANGPWAFHMNKNSNSGKIMHILQGSKGVIYVPDLGKPYSEELENIKPTSVAMYDDNENVVLTYELASIAFTGIVLVQIFTLSASGHLTQKFLVKNTTALAKNVMLKNLYYSETLNKQSAFAKGGHLTTNHGSLLSGAEAVEEKDFTENWIFEQGAHVGACWPKDFNADMSWATYFELETDFGEVAAGGACETGEVEFVYGTFTNFSQFRDYVQEKYRDRVLPPKSFIEIQTHDENPFAYDTSFCLDVINNRNSVLKGRFALSSTDGLFEDQEQENLTDEVIEKNSFDIQLTDYPFDGICRLSLDLDFEGYEVARRMAIFLPKGSVTCTEDDDGVLTVANNHIVFKADEKYSDGIFSLLFLDEGEKREWFMHKYPEHAPNAYWNPFYGGIQFRPEGLNEQGLLKERKTAEFVEMKDNFGNIWSGIKVRVDVVECEELKGVCYENYFVTLPGVPVLCHFSKIYNNTGAFRKLGFHTAIFPSGGKNLAESKLTYIGGGHVKRLINTGTLEHFEYHKASLVEVSSKRYEKLYVYRDRFTAASGKGNLTSGSNEFIQLYKYYETKLAHGDMHVASPVFMVLTKKELTEEMFRDLEKVTF